MLLGAIIPQEENNHIKKGDSLTSYEVDPDEPIISLGMITPWKYINMRMHIVCGIPYRKVNFGDGSSASESGGKSERSKTTMPTIIAGDAPRSILMIQMPLIILPTLLMTTKNGLHSIHQFKRW